MSLSSPFQANVRLYYQQFEEQQTQSLIDQRIKEHLGQAAVYQQVGVAYNPMMVQRPSSLPILPPPRLPIPGNAPILGSQPLIPGMRPVLPRPGLVPPGEHHLSHLATLFIEASVSHIFTCRSRYIVCVDFSFKEFKLRFESIHLFW